jgi:hypothetical protein
MMEKLRDTLTSFPDDPMPKRRRKPAVDDKQIRARGNRAGGAEVRPRSTVAQDLQAVRLAKALQALSQGLPNPWDESTDYFRGFTAAMPTATKLTADSFRAVLGIGARYEIALSSADEVLTKVVKARVEGKDSSAAGYRQLAAVMRATLTDRTLVFARGKGVVRVRVWMFGRAESGALVGLRSIGTET